MVTPVERRRQVAHVGIALVNWQQEEPTDFDGRRQPSRSGTSRISREAYVRFCERLGVKLSGPTRRSGNGACATAPDLDSTPRVPEPKRARPEGAVVTVLYQQCWLDRTCYRAT